MSALWHYSVASCSPQGKSSFHHPTLQALSVTGERWIRDQKDLFISFFPPHLQVIFTVGPWGSAQSHTHPFHRAGFFISATWGSVIIRAKSFWPKVFKDKLQVYILVKGKYFSTELAFDFSILIFFCQSAYSLHSKSSTNMSYWG